MARGKSTKLKPFQNLMESGKIRLEVVADDTLFVPYESTYEIEESKSVTVEVLQSEQQYKKPVVEVKVETQKPVPKIEEAKPIVKKKNPITEIKKYLESSLKSMNYYLYTRYSTCHRYIIWY